MLVNHPASLRFFTSDANGISDFAEISYTADGATFWVEYADMVTDTILSANLTVTPTTLGAHRVGVTVVDWAGASCSSTIEYQAVNAAPVCNPNVAVVPAPALLGQTAAVTLSASDANSVFDVVEIKYTFNGVTDWVPFFEPLSDTELTSTVSVVPKAGKDNVVVFTVMDAQGAQCSVSVDVDAANAAPSCAAQASIDPNPAQLNQPATVTFMASDANSAADIKSITMSYNGGPAERVANLQHISDFSVSASVRVIPDRAGEQSVVFTVVDAAGSECTSGFKFVVENAGPQCDASVAIGTRGGGRFVRRWGAAAAGLWARLLAAGTAFACPALAHAPAPD